MSDPFVKAFTQLLDSTVWGESPETCKVWMTMMLMADARGHVLASVPGLARRAVLTVEQVETALACFLGPDPYSRTPDNEGRRIEKVDGGWRLLNYSAFRARRSASERAEYQREWDRAHRPDRPRADKRTPDNPRQPPTTPDVPRPKQIAEAYVEQKQKQKPRLPSVASCPEPQAAAGRNVVGTMPTLGGEEWGVTQDHLTTWTAAYPGIDVKAELRKAKAWLVSNPIHAKTARGMGRFCNGWLERAQNAVGRNGTGPPAERESLQARVARKSGLKLMYGLMGESDGQRADAGLVGGDGGDLRPPLEHGDGRPPD